MKRVFLTAAFAFIATLSLNAQTLYGVTEDNRLITMNPADGSELTEVATGVGGSTRLFGLAVDPTSLVASPGEGYLSIEGAPWSINVVDFSDGSVTQVGTTGERFRDLTFDNTGQLWGVTGSGGSNATQVLTIDKSTAATTVENSSPGISRLKIANDPDTNTMYLMGLNGSTWEIYSFSPSDPTTLTQITLSGDSFDIGGTRAPSGFTYDTTNDVLITIHEMDNVSGTDWDVATIDPATGVVTRFLRSEYGGNNVSLDFNNDAASDVESWESYD